jgi:hypothetical protein
MGSKRFDNIEFCCQNGARVLVRCTHCRHEIQFSPWDLWDRMKATRKCGRNSSFGAASNLLRCTKCGTRRPIVEPTMKSR